MGIVQPPARADGLGMIEVMDGRGREGLGERSHALLPSLLADYRQTIDGAEVIDRDLGLRPEGTRGSSRENRSYRTARSTFRIAARGV